VSGRLAYLDASAFLKLPFQEAEASALTAELNRWPVRVSSALLVVEAGRAARRVGPAQVAAVQEGLDRLLLIPIDDQVLGLAEEVGAPALRSLDAIHLATATLVDTDLGIVFTYDRRMIATATELGLPVASPA